MNLTEAQRQRLWEAVTDVCWEATQFGETEDGDTYAYIVPKGAIHRLVGAAQAAGINAALRSEPETDPLAGVTQEEMDEEFGP